MKEKREILIEFLQNSVTGSGAWVIRKEVFAWAAAVLYLTGLFVLISNHSNSSIVLFNCTWFLPVLLFVFLLLFLLLIHTQFVSLTHDTAAKVVLTRLIFRLIRDSEDLSLIMDSPIQNYKTFPDEIQEEIKVHQDYIRRYKIFSKKILLKLFLPFYFIYLRLLLLCLKTDEVKDEYKEKVPQKFELEEVLIYYLLLIAYILFVLLYFSVLDC